MDMCYGWDEWSLVCSKGRIFQTGSGRLSKSEHDAKHYLHLILRLQTCGDIFRCPSPCSWGRGGTVG
jgi:hypothetical protein